jgi:5'-deoxynucleotidase YfbR-like HD superfamily hydrolase
MLGDDLKGEVQKMIELTDEEKLIAKDADQLELALEAKEFIDRGYSRAQMWIDRIGEVLQTKSAKKLLDEIKSTHSCDWWKDLKKKPQTNEKDYVSRV